MEGNDVGAVHVKLKRTYRWVGLGMYMHVKRPVRMQLAYWMLGHVVTRPLINSHSLCVPMSCISMQNSCTGQLIVRVSYITQVEFRVG